MEFGESKPVMSLLANHPDYDKKDSEGRRIVDCLKYYYEGGPEFPVKDELRWKPIELSADPVAGPMRKARVGAGFYTNYFVDAIVDLVSIICKTALLIECGDEAADYWEELSENADGQFATPTALARSSLADDFVYDRAYYYVRFPQQKTGADANLQTQLDAGDLDAQITTMDAHTVTDWELDEYGGLIWARCSEMSMVRSAPNEPYDMERYRWTFYAPDALYVYEAMKKPTEKFSESSPPAQLVEKEVHSLGVCPVFNVIRKLKCAVGKKLLPTTRQLFNEESDGSYYQMTTITGGLFIFSDNAEKWKSIQLSPFGAPIGGKDDKVERDKADAPTLQALSSAAAERRGQIGGLIHAMARQTAAQSASGQNTSRATGAHLSATQDPLHAFLRAFAEAQLAVWRRMITAIGNVREEDVSEVEPCGLVPEEPEDSPITLETMQAEQIFGALPHVPDAAKQAHGRDLGLEVNPDADAKLKKQIQTQKIEKPAPVAAVGAGAGKHEPTKPAQKGVA